MKLKAYNHKTRDGNLSSSPTTADVNFKSALQSKTVHISAEYS